LKELLGIVAVAAVAIGVLYVLGRRKQEAAGTGTATTDQCFTLKNFINTVEEGAGLSIPSIEGIGGGGFSGWRSNVTGKPDLPNVITGTGAAVTANNPNMDFASGAQLPMSHRAMPRLDLRRALLY
jgi:hypothetical protein